MLKLKKDDNGNSAGRIQGTALKTKSQTPINIRLDQKVIIYFERSYGKYKIRFLVFQQIWRSLIQLNTLKKYLPKKHLNQLYPDVKFHKS